MRKGKKQGAVRSKDFVVLLRVVDVQGVGDAAAPRIDDGCRQGVRVR